MVGFTNEILKELGNKALCSEVIISGGVKSFLDGHFLMSKLQCRSIYGQGSAMLERARNSYEQLHNYIEGQVRGLELANAYLRVK
jgi:isopentenyl-diphosphate delta-isomerase